MARNLANKPNVNSPDSDYPYGRIRDRDPGVTAGTRVDENAYGDMHQFFAKMFSASGLTYNELPDNDYSGFQFWAALNIAIRKNESADTQKVLLPAPFQTFNLAYIDITGMTLTTPDDGVSRVYDLMIQLDCSRGVGANDIGAYFKVMHGATDVKEALTRVAAGSPHDVCVTFFASKITIPPNTIVKLQQKCVNGATNEPIIINGELYIKQVG